MDNAAYMRKYLKEHPEQKNKSDARWKLHQVNKKKKLREIIDRLKQVPCSDCSHVYPSYVMDFDHRDPGQKLDTISNMIRDGKSLEVVTNEILKCDVVCSNCHRERTHRQREQGKI